MAVDSSVTPGERLAKQIGADGRDMLPSMVKAMAMAFRSSWGNDARRAGSHGAAGAATSSVVAVPDEYFKEALNGLGGAAGAER
jgi:hypothetical protein